MGHRVRTMATRARRRAGHRSRPAQQGLESRLASGEAVVAVIGLGYVGLPLACEFARSGLRVLGIDVDAAKAGEIAAGRSHVQDVASSDLRPLTENGRLRAGTRSRDA